jgi:hypothetical protein
MVLENNNYKIVLLEKVSCNDKTELLARERFYIENNECVNKQIPHQTRNEVINRYKENNVEKVKESSKNYRLENADKIKEFRILNTESMKNYNKEYYIKNKEKLKRQNAERGREEINRKRRERNALKKQQA